MDRSKRYCKLRVRANKRKTKRTRMPTECKVGTDKDENDVAKFKLDRFIEDVKKYAAKAKKSSEKEKSRQEKKCKPTKLHVADKRGLFENAVLSKTIQFGGGDPVIEGKIHIARLRGDLSTLAGERPEQSTNEKSSGGDEVKENREFDEAHSKILNRIICGSEKTGGEKSSEQDQVDNVNAENAIQMQSSSNILEESYKRFENVLQTVEPQVVIKTLENVNERDFKTPKNMNVSNSNMFDGPSRRDAIEGKLVTRTPLKVRADQKPNEDHKQVDMNGRERSKYSKSAAEHLKGHYSLPNFIHPLEDIILHNELCHQHLKKVSLKVAEVVEKRGKTRYSHTLKKFARNFVNQRMMETSPPPESSSLGSELTLLFGKEKSQYFKNMLNSIDVSIKNRPDECCSKSSGNMGLGGDTTEHSKDFLLNEQIARRIHSNVASETNYTKHLNDPMLEARGFASALTSPQLGRIQNKTSCPELFHNSMESPNTRLSLEFPSTKNHEYSSNLNFHCNIPEEMYASNLVFHNGKERHSSPYQAKESLVITPILKLQNRLPPRINLTEASFFRSPKVFDKRDVSKNPLLFPIHPRSSYDQMNSPALQISSPFPSPVAPSIRFTHVQNNCLKKRKYSVRPTPSFFHSESEDLKRGNFYPLSPFRNNSNKDLLHDYFPRLNKTNPGVHLDLNMWLPSPSVVFNPRPTNINETDNSNVFNSNENYLNDSVDSIFHKWPPFQRAHNIEFKLRSPVCNEATFNKGCNFFKPPQATLAPFLQKYKRTKICHNSSTSFPILRSLEWEEPPKITGKCPPEDYFKPQSYFCSRQLPLFSPHNF